MAMVLLQGIILRLNSVHTTGRNPPGSSRILSYNKLTLFLKFLHFLNNNNRDAPKVGGGGGAAGL